MCCWQDIVELFDVGIEVYIVFNVQYLESCNDQVCWIIGIIVCEIVFDVFFDCVCDIVLVDLLLCELIGWFKQGKVYVLEIVVVVFNVFFLLINLVVLCELVVEIIVGYVDSDLCEYMFVCGMVMLVCWYVLVVIDGYGQSDYLVCVVCCIVEWCGVLWSVVFVGIGVMLDLVCCEWFDVVMWLVEWLGGEMIILCGYVIVDELFVYVDCEGVGQIIFGCICEWLIVCLFGILFIQQLLCCGVYMELIIIVMLVECVQVCWW